MNEERPIRVLLVDDDEDQYVMVDELLSSVDGTPYQLEWAPDFEAGVAAVSHGEHDVYLMDHRLGVRTGLDLLRRAIEGGCTAPVILLTGLGDRDVERDAMRIGAADYIEKDDVTVPLLDRSIRYAMLRAESTRALREEEKRYRRLVEGANVIPWEMSLDEHRFTYVGPQASAILGYSTESWNSPGFCERVIHPEDRERAMSICGMSKDPGHAEVEFRMMTSDGRTVWLRNVANRDTDVDGK